MKKQWMVNYLTLVSLLVLAVMVPRAGAFDTYSVNRNAGNCADCHGNYRTVPYISNHDGVQWTQSLHDGHRNNMLSGDCNVCHAVSGRFPVSTFSSAGGTGFPAIGCVGCHDGAGLRAHHVNSGATPIGSAGYCYDCHGQTTSPAENVKPAYYFTPDTAHPNKPTDPCNLNGSESAIAPPLGLDNDGNLLYDQNDPACVAAAAKISVTPTTLSFGNQAINATSAAQTVTISNTGTASLSVSGIANSNGTDFIITAPSTPFSVAVGGSQTFTLAFRPGSSGAKSTTISITSNGGNATVTGAGTGVAPLLSVAPTTLAFGNQTVGTTSAAQTVTISNSGTGTLNVTGIMSSNAEFAFSPTAISPIAPGGSATLNITFAPATAGAKSATISITSAGGNATISATGTGVAVSAGVLSVSPTTLTYGSQTVGTASAAQTVTFSNTGNAALTVNSITNGNTGDFALTGPATPVVINAGASQTLTVAFKPATAGAKSATISITSTGGNATISATGTGVAVSAGAMNVSPLTFGNQTVGTTSSALTVTISNAGTASLNVTGIANSNSTDFIVTTPATPFTVAAGGSQTFTVAFKPGSTGVKSATISITSTSGESAVNATGTGVAIASQPVLSVAPGALTFSDVTVGATVTRTATITNTGNAPLNIANITSAGSAAFRLSPASVAPIAAGATASLAVTYAPTVAGTDTGSVYITSNGGNATIGLSGTAIAAVTGDVGLVTLNVPAQINSTLNTENEIDALVFAFTSVNEVDATVSMSASSSEGVRVRIDEAGKKEKIYGNQQKRFEYDAKVLCTKLGTWPITWTARISSAQNSNPGNDTLTGTTQVNCTLNRRGLFGIFRD